VNDDLVRKLAAASRAETPRPGARVRAVSVLMAGLREPVVAGANARRFTIAGVGGFLLVASVLAGAVSLKHQQDAQAAYAAQASELAAQKAEVDLLMAQLNEQTKSVADLRLAMENAKDDAARAAAAKQLLEAERESALVRKAIAAGRSQSAGGGARVRPWPKKACDCPPGDPLCSCIP
jgi:colicin import membrane protein